MPTRFFVFLAATDRLCDALISTRPHDSNPDWGNRLLEVDARFESASDISVRPAGRTTTVATGAMNAKVATPSVAGPHRPDHCLGSLLNRLGSRHVTD
jgi:hypothetical protein